MPTFQAMTTLQTKATEYLQANFSQKGSQGSLSIDRSRSRWPRALNQKRIDTLGSMASIRVQIVGHLFTRESRTIRTKDKFNLRMDVSKTLTSSPIDKPLFIMDRDMRTSFRALIQRAQHLKCFRINTTTKVKICLI